MTNKNITLDPLKNYTCLGQGCTYPTDEKLSGLNGNEIIVGPTRVGKTMSVVEPRLLHTYDSNLIVSVTKRALVDTYAPIFEERGYEVLDLNLVDTWGFDCNISFDPMKAVRSERDVRFLAKCIMGDGSSTDRLGNLDPYWNQAAESVISALLGLVFLQACDKGCEPTFEEFLEKYKYATPNTEVNDIRSSLLDSEFDKLEKAHRGNTFSQQWRTYFKLPDRTSACVYSTMQAKMDKLFSKDMEYAWFAQDKKLSFRDFTDKKKILFITTSPVDKTLQKYTDILFAQAFKELFEMAEEKADRRLPIPVHLIYDDFATGGVIPDFSEYLSIFCAKRMSVTLLLQSESQLESMYGKFNATTIINNCDTYLYMGGMDNTTCQNISLKANAPLEDVYALPREKVYVIRRGSRPKLTRRYQTLEDEMYRKLVLERKEEKERE